MTRWSLWDAPYQAIVLLSVLPAPDGLAARGALMAGGVMLNALPIGPLTQAFLPWVTVRDHVGSG